MYVLKIHFCFSLSITYWDIVIPIVKFLYFLVFIFHYNLSLLTTTKLACNLVIEAYKKHYPPSLNDDVWRLVRIAKDGKFHRQLSLHGIHTVKDLLQLYTINPSSLHEVKDCLSFLFLFYVWIDILYFFSPLYK